MKHGLFLLPLLFAAPAFANICGTDYQNFNPTTNGLDFVTVQSSETLKPCIINAGLFLNYASNSLTYTETLNANYPKGQKRKDKIFGADLSVGVGLTDRWDIGLSVPFVLSQSVQDDYYVSSFDETGATEVKASTKYHLLGDERGGLALLVSLNKNLIEDNPFAGKDPGLTWNFELAADTTFAEKWALGLNVGYRDRNPGEPLANVPFIPMEDQYIYSIAGSYLFSSIDTKLILELYGSQAAKHVDQDTDRSLNSLEALAGIKHDLNQNVALHFGTTRQIDASLGGAEWRVYTGLNWAIGPVCKQSPVIEQVPPPSAPAPTSATEASAPSAPAAGPEVFKLDVELIFKFNSEKIEPDYAQALDSSFQKIVEKKFQRIQVEGHTDSTGIEVYNQYLSEKRAQAIRDYLVEKFKVTATSVEAVGYGSNHPIADNGNYQGRRKNRRVELKIWPQESKLK